MRRKIVAILALLILSASAASAQEHELGFQIGAMGTEDRDVRLPIPGFVRTGNGLAYQVSYANRLYNAHLASLHVELPITVTPKTDINSSNALSPRSYSSFFITPGLKLKFLPFAPASPYVVAGIGYARFNGSDTTVNNQANTGDRTANRAVFDYGGGVDVKVFPFVSLRGEVRDFISGNPKLNADLIGDRQHNLLISGGIVLRF